MFKAAVIGAGFIGKAHIEAIRRLGNVDIVALCDGVDVERKAQECNINNFYSDYRLLFSQNKPDVIHICTPNNTHYEIAKACIENGVNFICEKPFTMTVGQAEELVRFSRDKHVKGMINFHNRMYPMINEIRQMVKQGEIGKVFSVHGEYVQDWLMYDTDYSWRLDSSQVGKTRAIADIGSHLFDIVEFITGDRIVSLVANFRVVHDKRKKPLKKNQTFEKGICKDFEEVNVDTEDIASILFKMKSGTIGSFFVSQVFSGKKNTTVINISGSKESAVWTSEDLNNLYIGLRDEANRVLTKDSSLMHARSASLVSYPSGHIEGFPDAFKQGFKQFYDSLAVDGEYDYATLEDGLREMRLNDAVYCSNQRQAWVEV